MLTDLDSPSGLDPVRVGGKAAALAALRAAGAPVLPGFVVDGSASIDHMRIGRQALSERGSGGARLAVSGAPIGFAEELVRAGTELGDRLVARSSTVLEISSEWAGAFTSYVDIRPADLPKAVVGCWSSAFAVSALERQRVADVEPGSFEMAVLVQTAVDPQAGGWAEKDAHGVVTVHGIKGPPAPLLQGWVTGLSARLDGTWAGEELIELIGVPTLEEIKGLLDAIEHTTGGNHCEWALDGRAWILQAGRREPEPEPAGYAPGEIDLPDRLVDFARMVVLAPGPLGESLVHPWALGGAPHVEPEVVSGEGSALDRARELSDELTAQVWAKPAQQARSLAAQVMSELVGGEVETALERMKDLEEPDPAMVARLLGCLQAVRLELADSGVVPDPRDVWHLGIDETASALDGNPVRLPPRLGIGRWEHFVAWVVLRAGDGRVGTPASAGLGAGRRVEVGDPHERRTDRRGVVTAAQPLPSLASLLWDAAGVVTSAGSPAAHLFESARALRIPAVCGVDLGVSANQIVAVDGHTGRVSTLDLGGEA